MEMDLENAIKGIADYSNDGICKRQFIPFGGWMGFHDLGEDVYGENIGWVCSDNNDYLLQSGFITNSLAGHYLKWYRKTLSYNQIFKACQSVCYTRNNYDKEKNIYEYLKTDEFLETVNDNVKNKLVEKYKLKEYKMYFVF